MGHTTISPSNSPIRTTHFADPANETPFAPAQPIESAPAESSQPSYRNVYPTLEPVIRQEYISLHDRIGIKLGLIITRDHQQEALWMETLESVVSIFANIILPLLINKPQYRDQSSRNYGIGNTINHNHTHITYQNGQRRSNEEEDDRLSVGESLALGAAAGGSALVLGHMIGESRNNSLDANLELQNISVITAFSSDAETTFHTNLREMLSRISSTEIKKIGFLSAGLFAAFGMVFGAARRSSRIVWAGGFVGLGTGVAALIFRRDMDAAEQCRHIFEHNQRLLGK